MHARHLVQIVYVRQRRRLDSKQPDPVCDTPARKFVADSRQLAGGAGVQYYFGYQLPENDLVCEDFRSRDRSWDYCRIALDFFRDHQIPFERMACMDELVGNPKNENSRYFLADPGKVYVVYLPNGGAVELDLADTTEHSVQWFNPRTGGPLQDGPTTRVNGRGKVSLGQPPSDPDQDWVVLVRAK